MTKCATAFRWFVVVIAGLVTRTGFLGVTSFIRSLFIHPSRYESLLHFFRSDAFSTLTLKKAWHSLILRDAPLYIPGDRTLLIGDGTKHPKEGYFMPGVKKLFQESGNSSKPEYIFGHMYGGAGIVIGSVTSMFCLPLDMNIRDGLADISSWNKAARDTSSHVLKMIRNGYSAAGTFGSSYLLLDRYFLTVPALAELDSLNREDPLLDIITRARTSCVAYGLPPTSPSPRRGRPRKKGDAIKLQALFLDRASDFLKGKAMMYGKMESVEYLCLDLLWGAKLYRKLRFVPVKSSRGNCILACTDLTLDPLLIIEAYAHHHKTECTFRELKRQAGVFCYHFWTKAMPKLNKRKKKGEPSELSQADEQQQRLRILKTTDATERFVLCSCIAMGLAQMTGLTPSIAKTVREHRYLRTSPAHKVSEATVLEYLRKNFFRLLCLNPTSEISQLILSLQIPEQDDNDDLISA